MVLLLGAVLLFGVGVAPAGAAPRKVPTAGLQKVAVGTGSQVRPGAALLSKGTVLVAFERLFTAHRRRVYVTRRRPKFGFSWARALPLAKGDFTQRDPTMVVQKADRVLLYVQVGDLRRRRSAVRLYRSQGDSLRWTDAGRLKLQLGGSAAKLVLTQPFATTDGAGGVLLTVTRRFARGADGCHLAHSSDGLRFGPLRRIGAGDRCRVVALTRRSLVLTYQSRARRSLPWRSYFRRSTDGGKTWSKPRAVSALRSTSDVHTLVGPGSTLRFLFVVTLPRGSAIQSARWTGSKRVERRLTRPGKHRDISPFGLQSKVGSWVFFARETKPLDFDVQGLLLKLPQSPPKP